MRYLIDGYNLLHAMGVLHGPAGPRGLEKARLRLLGLLRGTYGDQASDVTVVFDAAGAPPGATEEQSFQGIQLRFAIRQPEADDLIELLIGHDSAPQQLVVVSDDHRLQQAARRRHCLVVGCQDYLESLDRQRRLKRQRPAALPEKADAPTQEETQRWLTEFADLEHDPDWQELSDPYGFKNDLLREADESRDGEPDDR